MSTFDPKSFAVAVLLSAPLFAACSPAVSGDYAGDPQFTIHGVISGPAPSPAPVAPSIGILWYNFAKSGDVAAGEVLPITSTSFPANFAFDLLGVPPDPVINVFQKSDGTVDGEIGLGYVIAFDDVDRNGTFSPSSGGDGVAAPDRFIGWVNDRMLLYVRTLPSATSYGSALFINPSELRPGYQLGTGVCKQGGFDQLVIGQGDANVQLLLSDVPKATCLNVF